MKLKFLLFALVAVFLMAGSAAALTVNGTNITGYDGEHGPGNPWWNNQNEDQEVEVGMATGQQWDMEAIYWDSSATTLYMVAGFDFSTETSGWAAGDVFLFGANDYVLDFKRVDDDVYSALDISDGNRYFDVYKADHGGFQTIAPYFEQNLIPSNPYALDDNPGSKIGNNKQVIDADGAYGETALTTGVGYDFGEVENDLGLLALDGTHYALALYLGGITDFNISDYQVFMTLECGNDAMRSVPEPATMLLLGTGLVCFAGFGRKRLFKRG